MSLKVKNYNILFFIAIRYLFHNKASNRYKYLPSIGSLISIIAVTLSISMLIIVSSVMNGFGEELLNSIVGFNAHVTLYESNGSNFTNAKLNNALSDIKNIKLYTPIINSNGMIFTKHDSSGILIKGVSRENLTQRSELTSKINANFNEFTDNGSVVILGRELAMKLGVRKFDTVNLVVPNFTRTMFGTFPKVKTLKVIGTIRTGFSLYDSATIIVPIEQLKNILNMENPNSVEILLNNKQLIIETEQAIASKMSNIYITDWQKDNKPLLNAQKMEATIMTLIIGIFLIISMFTIFAIMTMTVNEKEREIAILKSIGLTNQQILIIFFISGFIMASIGMLFGNLIGITIAKNIEEIRLFINRVTGSNLLDPSVYIFSRMPSKIIVSNIISYNILSFTLAILSSLLPAIRASKKEPVTILRGL